VTVARVAVENIEPGMVLSRPVLNAGGMVMIGENTGLTAELIEKIRNMGVTTVSVKGLSQGSGSKEEALLRVEERFRNVGDESHMELLKTLIKEHLEKLYG
jgi:tetraacyldisaccharide-1-P 4'-kinase